jgi:transcriptional regulator with XRE-family HTH domain
MITIDEKALARQVGDCMRRARHARKWTQARVAREIGISVRSYGHIERAAALPSLETFFDLLTLFELTPSTVLGQPSAATPSRGEDTLALRRLARRLRRASPRTIALISRLLDELDTLRHGTNLG